jgi:hypothetical protein
MMDLERAVREAVKREIAPLLANCERIRAEINRTESSLPILLDEDARLRSRVDVIMRRARLECLLNELRLVEDRILHIADQRWPSWRLAASARVRNRNRRDGNRRDLWPFVLASCRATTLVEGGHGDP